MNTVRDTKQVFGLTKSTAYVEGEAIHFEMTATGTFAAVTPAPMDFSAWDALTDDQKQAICDDARGGYTGFFRKDGAS